MSYGNPEKRDTIASRIAEKIKIYLAPSGEIVCIVISGTAVAVSAGALHYKEYFTALWAGSPEQVASLGILLLAGVAGTAIFRHISSTRKQEESTEKLHQQQADLMEELGKMQVLLQTCADKNERDTARIQQMIVDRESTAKLHSDELKRLTQINAKLFRHSECLARDNELLLRLVDDHRDDGVVENGDHIAIKRNKPKAEN